MILKEETPCRISQEIPLNIQGFIIQTILMYRTFIVLKIVLGSCNYLRKFMANTTRENAHLEYRTKNKVLSSSKIRRLGIAFRICKLVAEFNSVLK